MLQPSRLGQSILAQPKTWDMSLRAVWPRRSRALRFHHATHAVPTYNRRHPRARGHWKTKRSGASWCPRQKLRGGTAIPTNLKENMILSHCRWLTYIIFPATESLSLGQLRKRRKKFSFPKYIRQHEDSHQDNVGKHFTMYLQESVATRSAARPEIDGLRQREAELLREVRRHSNDSKI